MLNSVDSANCWPKRPISSITSWNY